LKILFKGHKQNQSPLWTTIY